MTKKEMLESLMAVIEALRNIPDDMIESYDIVTMLKKLREQNGGIFVRIETPNSSAMVQLKDALIYEGRLGEIVLDSENVR